MCCVYIHIYKINIHLSKHPLCYYICYLLLNVSFPFTLCWASNTSIEDFDTNCYFLLDIFSWYVAIFVSLFRFKNIPNWIFFERQHKYLATLLGKSKLAILFDIEIFKYFHSMSCGAFNTPCLTDFMMKGVCMYGSALILHFDFVVFCSVVFFFLFFPHDNVLPLFSPDLLWSVFLLHIEWNEWLND